MPKLFVTACPVTETNELAEKNIFLLVVKTKNGENN